MYARRSSPRHNRGRNATSGGVAPYVAPTVPQAILDVGGVFYWADDVSDPLVWTPRYDTISAGNFTGVSTTLESGGWVTPEGNKPSIRIARASTAYLRNDALASMASPDDAPLEYTVWYQGVAANNASALVAWSSSSSTTPKRVLLYTTAGWRWTQQATVAGGGAGFAHNATNLLQQMVHVKQINNGAGTTTSLWRNDEVDPAGDLTSNVAAQACDRFLVGAQWNGGSGIANVFDCRIRGIYVRNPAAAPLSAAQRRDLHDWGQGAYSARALYTGATAHRRLYFFGQSNAQGLATGAVAGLPDANVKTYMRNLNNTATNPTALASLDLRGSVHGSWAYAQAGSFSAPHHIPMVGKGATNAGSDWGGNNGSGPTNSLQGYYSTDLYSECRRNIFVVDKRIGGTATKSIVWWQGENDAAAGAVVAGQYGTNAATIFAYLRALCGDATAKIYSVQLNPEQTGGGIVLADLNTIRAAMVTLAGSDANVHLIETNDLTAGTYLQGDNLHYNALGYSTIWDRIEASILANQP